MNRRVKLKAILVGLVIALCSLGLIYFLGVTGIYVAIPTSILVIVLTNLDWAASVIASGYILGRGVHFWFEKNAVEKRLEVMLASSSKKINEEGVDLLPHGVDIKWAEPSGRDAFLKAGKIVVCLESSHNEARNFARAVMLYVNEDLLRDSQHYVDNLIMISAKLSLGRKMLIIDRKPDALRYFNEEFVEPEVGKRPKIGDYITSMQTIDEQGHFTRILLREFAQLGPKLSPKIADPQAMKETIGFTDFLSVFESRGKEEDVRLDHSGKTVRLALLPVARAGATFDTQPYVIRAIAHHSNLVETIYALARGKGNIAFAELVVEQIEKKQIYRKQEVWEFKIPKESGSEEKALDSYIAVLSRIG